MIQLPWSCCLLSKLPDRFRPIQGEESWPRQPGVLWMHGQRNFEDTWWVVPTMFVCVICVKVSFFCSPTMLWSRKWQWKMTICIVGFLVMMLIAVLVRLSDGPGRGLKCFGQVQVRVLCLAFPWKVFGLKWRTLVFVGRHNMPSTSFVHALNCAPRKASATSRKGRITGSNRPFSTSKLQLENHPMFFQIADFNLRCVISESFVIRPISERCWICDQVVPSSCWKLPPVWRGLLGWEDGHRKELQNPQDYRRIKDWIQHDVSPAGASSFWSYLVLHYDELIYILIWFYVNLCYIFR